MIFDYEELLQNENIQKLVRRLEKLDRVTFQDDDDLEWIFPECWLENEDIGMPKQFYGCLVVFANVKFPYLAHSGAL